MRVAGWEQVEVLSRDAESVYTGRDVVRNDDTVLGFKYQNFEQKESLLFIIITLILCRKI